MLYGLCFVTSDACSTAEVRIWKEKLPTPEVELIFFVSTGLNLEIDWRQNFVLNSLNDTPFEK